MMKFIHFLSDSYVKKHLEHTTGEIQVHHYAFLTDQSDKRFLVMGNTALSREPALSARFTKRSRLFWLSCPPPLSPVPSRTGSAHTVPAPVHKRQYIRLTCDKKKGERKEKIKPTTPNNEPFNSEPFCL